MLEDNIIWIEIISLIVVILLPPLSWLGYGKGKEEEEKSRVDIKIATAVGVAAATIIFGVVYSMFPKMAPKKTINTPPVYRIEYVTKNAARSGTGFHFRYRKGASEKHYLATCYHVIEKVFDEMIENQMGAVVVLPGTKQIPVDVIKENKKEKFEIIGYNNEADVAILEPMQKGLLKEWGTEREPFELSRPIKLLPGQQLLTYGYPGNLKKMVFEDLSVRTEPGDEKSVVELNGKAQMGQSGSPIVLTEEEDKRNKVVGILKAVKQERMELPATMYALEVWSCPIERLHNLIKVIEASEIE